MFCEGPTLSCTLKLQGPKRHFPHHHHFSGSLVYFLPHGASKLQLPKNTSTLNHCLHAYTKPICLSTLFSKHSYSTIYNDFQTGGLMATNLFPKNLTLSLPFPLYFYENCLLYPSKYSYFSLFYHRACIVPATYVFINSISDECKETPNSFLL